MAAEPVVRLSDVGRHARGVAEYSGVLAEKLEFTVTSQDGRVLDTLAHAQRNEAARGEYISALGEDGERVDISFATQNWQKAVVDGSRPGRFVRRHFEAMVFTHLAEELRTGDVAVVGSEEFADWSDHLLPWEVAEEKLPAYLVEVGLAEDEDQAAAFRRQLEDLLRGAAAAADAGYPDNESLLIDPDTGISSLKPHRSEGQRPSTKRLEQEIKARMPERTLIGICARTAYWVEWWRRFGPSARASSPRRRCSSGCGRGRTRTPLTPRSARSAASSAPCNCCGI
ncbi:hypothetical protein ACFU98_45690 [Streptomyces sp. NPDC057575]|uniref:hypothetical protein n=1 Tax=unclassified Streptomyces TaxID=2593676 RepID=UPI0036862478